MPTRPPRARPPGRRPAYPDYGGTGGQPGIDVGFYRAPGSPGGGPGAPAAGGGAGLDAPAPIARTMQVFPPELYPIPGAQEFRLNEQFASPAAGVLTPAALRTVIPDRYVGIVRAFSYAMLAMSAATVVKWELLVNGGPVAGYSFAFFPGAVPRISAAEDVYLRVPMGATLEVRFTNTDGAAYTVGAGYYGWFWQPAGAENWTGSAS